MSEKEVVLTGSPTKPDLKPRLGWFLVALGLFIAWGTALLALYFRAARA